MLLTICEVICDLMFVGFPCFILGIIVTLVVTTNRQYEESERRQKERKEVIHNIEFLTDIVIEKRREEQKVDVD